MNGISKRNATNVLIPLVLVVATLYFAREFLIPLALTILFSFLLAPLVQRLDRWGFGRVPSVLTASALALLAVVGIGYAVGGQLIDLAGQLPKYQSNLQAKIAAFKFASNHGVISQVTKTVKEVTEDIAKPVIDGEPSRSDSEKSAPFGPPPPPTQTSANSANGEKAGKLDGAKGPVPVTIVGTSTGVLQTIETYIEPIFTPLGRVALVVLMVIFFLLEREDMRDRLIHLIGRTHLQVTTQALDDAAQRVSRYLLAQLMVNVTYGILIAIGIYFIGLPNAVLWGMLATILRFVPYIGPWIAASFPIVLSIAIAPSWTVPATTFGLFLAVELLVSNAVEPWLYGASTGLSPIAVIAAAAFWTWLWGGIGLLLAVPLTVCIVVLGKHIPNLAFLDVLLGDKPPIAVADRLYQRLLATDEDEVEEIVEKYIEKTSLGDAFQDLIVSTLRLVDEDFLSGTLSDADRSRVLQDLHNLLADLEESHKPPANPPIEAQAVLCIPARDLADEIAALMLARLLADSGVSSCVIPSKLLASEMLEEVAKSSTRQFCVSVIPPGSTRQATYVCKRLRDRFPDARITVGLWGEPPDDDRRLRRVRHAQVDVVFTNILEAAREIVGTATVTAIPAVAPLTAATTASG